VKAYQKIPAPKRYFQNDILVFCETFLKEEDEFCIPGFNAAHKYAVDIGANYPRRGISCFVSPKLGQIVRTEETDVSLIVFLKDLVLICFYCPPNMNAANFKNSVIESLAKTETHDNVLVLGDFNARVDPHGAKSCAKNSKKGADLCEMMTQLDLTLANDKTDATFISGNGHSTIDLIFYDVNFLELQSCETMENIESAKHIPVKAKFLCKELVLNECDVEKIVRKIDEALLVENLNKNIVLFDQLLQENKIDDYYNLLIHLIKISGAKKNTNVRVAKVWYTSHCKAQNEYLLDIRSQIKELEANKLNMNKEVFQMENQRLHGQYTEAKSYYRHLCKTSREDFDAREEEKLIKKAEDHPFVVLRNSAKKLSTNISLDTWTQHFSNILNKSKKNADDSLRLKGMLENYELQDPCTPFLDEEIKLCVQTLKNGKAPGPDKILNEHLKLLVQCGFTSLITNLFNKCLQMSTVPKSWRLSTLKVLYKGKGEKGDVNNYRGIALSNTLYKLLDKTIIRRIFPNVSEFISDDQHGFVPGRSTIQAIQKLQNKIVEEVHQKDGELYVVFIDYTKAFDNVCREKLFGKLISFKKFPKQLLLLVADMLDVNFLQIDDGVQLSQIFVQSNGTLQGGPSSPIFYIVNNHDMKEKIGAEICSEVTVLEFADDIAAASKKLKTLQKFMDGLVTYSEENDLEINTKKTEVVKFRKSGSNNKKEKLYCKNQEIKFVNFFKYLGVTFKHTGKSFAKHVNNRCLAATVATFDIKHLQKLSVRAALELFVIKIEPILAYGISVIWPYLNEANLRSLNMVFDMYLKRMLCVHKSSKNRLIHHMLEVDSFVGHIQAKYNLPYTGSFGCLLYEREQKSIMLSPDFIYVHDTLPTHWTGPMKLDRHVFTRTLVHGFHFKFCTNAKFHSADYSACVCQFCHKKCGQYHSLFCKDTPFSSLHQLAGEIENDQTEN
jgi:hypothetical protein